MTKLGTKYVRDCMLDNYCKNVIQLNAPLANWFKETKHWIDNMYKEQVITEDTYKYLRNHLSSMIKYHKEKGNIDG